MQVKVTMHAVVATLVVALIPVVVAQYVTPSCPPVDDTDDIATLIPNVYNCSTFYLCSQGVRELIECPAGLHYNAVLQVCDFPYRAKCSEQPLPVQNEAPASEDSAVATERVVITKVVKEVFRPADSPAA
ncbi:uncharacterized protein LOC144178545 [Haemaphysalis longicornis]